MSKKHIFEMTKEERRELMGPHRHYLHIAAMRTGRTTRMMEEVVRHLAEGKTVWVVCATKDHAMALKHQWLDRFAMLPGTAHFESVDTMRPMWSWETLNSARVGRDDIVLVDTWAIESRFGAMLDMLHRWDR